MPDDSPTIRTAHGSASDTSIMATLTIIGWIILFFMLLMVMVLHFRTWRMAKEANAWIQLYLFSQPERVSTVNPA